MVVKYFNNYWNKANFISLTPLFKNADIVWYLVYSDKDGKLDYFYTKDLNNIIIYDNS